MNPAVKKTVALLGAWVSALALSGPARADVLTGSWGETVPLHAGVFSIAMGSQILQAPSGDGKAQDSAFLLKSLAELSSLVLRLPGGDMMNTWSYFKEGGMGVADFWKIAEAGNSTPLWGVNVTTADPAETERFANTLISEKADASLFELGNELYLSRWSKMTPTPEVYLQKAAAHAEVLRRHFPNARLGIPVSSYWGLASLRGGPYAWKKPEDLGPWVLGLAKRTDFYDAVVLHLYLVPTELGRSGLATHTADEVRRWAWVRSDATQVRDLFGLVHGVFPTKQIWVTEWAFNTSQYMGGKNRQEVRYQAHQTMLAALYNARFMLNTACYVPYAPIMTIWTLYGQPPVALLKGDHTEINFDLFRLIRWAREGSDGLARLELSHPPMVNGPAGPEGFDKLQSEAVDVFGFYKGDRLQSLMILNPQAEALSVSIPDLPQVRDARALTSPEILPDWGNPRNPSQDNWKPAYSIQKLAVGDNLVTVPANSISVVHMAVSFGP